MSPSLVVNSSMAFACSVLKVFFSAASLSLVISMTAATSDFSTLADPFVISSISESILPSVSRMAFDVNRSSVTSRNAFCFAFFSPTTNSPTRTSSFPANFEATSSRTSLAYKPFPCDSSARIARQIPLAPVGLLVAQTLDGRTPNHLLDASLLRGRELLSLADEGLDVVLGQPQLAGDGPGLGEDVGPGAFSLGFPRLEVHDFGHPPARGLQDLLFAQALEAAQRLTSLQDGLDDFRPPLRNPLA